MSYCITRDFMKKILSENFGEDEREFNSRESRRKFTIAQRDVILEEAKKVSFMVFDFSNRG